PLHRAPAEPPGRSRPVSQYPRRRTADRLDRPGRAAAGRTAAVGPVGGGLRRAGPAGVPLGVERPQADPAVEGRECPSPPGAAPAHPDRHPLQPPPPGVLREAGGRRKAEAAGGGGLHAQAGDALLRGAEEPRPVRPRVGLKKGPLTTHYLVRPPAVGAEPRTLATIRQPAEAGLPGGPLGP